MFKKKCFEQQSLLYDPSRKNTRIEAIDIFMIMSHACLRHQHNVIIKCSKISNMTNVVLIVALDISMMMTMMIIILFVVRSLIISPQYLIRFLQHILCQRSMRNRQARPITTISLLRLKRYIVIVSVIYNQTYLFIYKYEMQKNELLLKSLSKILFDINIKDFCRLFGIICSRNNRTNILKAIKI